MSSFRKGSLTGKCAYSYGRNDMGLRRLVEHPLEEGMPAAVAQKHHGGCARHAGDSLGDIGTVPTMDNDLWRDPMLLHETLQVSRSLPIVSGFVGIQDDLSVGPGGGHADKGAVVLHPPDW